MNCFTCFFSKPKNPSFVSPIQQNDKSLKKESFKQPALIVNITSNQNQLVVNNFAQIEQNHSKLVLNTTPKKSAFKKQPSYNRKDDPDRELSRFENQ